MIPKPRKKLKRANNPFQKKIIRNLDEEDMPFETFNEKPSNKLLPGLST